MNEVVNKFSLTGDKSMPEMHLRQLASLNKSGFTYSVCGPLTKNKERVQKFKETGNLRYIYRNELQSNLFKRPHL